MADRSGIQWTDATWNPIRGCARVSKGCENCYAERQAHRMNHPGGAYEGLTVLGKRGPRWSGGVRLVPELLEQPLRWTRPRLVFVNSMSDLFHPDVPFEFIAAVFAVMASTPRHTFQVLTKRPERAVAFFRWVEEQRQALGCRPLAVCLQGVTATDANPLGIGTREELRQVLRGDGWPLRNVWLGVSAEDQAAADERVPLLLQCPAAVRWVSAEPLLGPVNFGKVNWASCPREDHDLSTPAGAARYLHGPRLDWVVVGGESGPRARPCALEWIGGIVEQCRDAEVPVFVKQLGAAVVSEERPGVDGERWGWQAGLRHRKGGDPEEWPEALRVRRWPAGVDHG